MLHQTTKSILTLLCAVFVLLFDIPLSSKSLAAPRTYQYTSTIDLTELGGSADAVFDVVYTFEDNEIDTDPSSIRAVYRNVDATATIGADVFTISNASIIVENERPLSFSTLATDAYSFGASSSSGSIINGTLLGGFAALIAFDFQWRDDRPLSSADVVQDVALFSTPALRHGNRVQRNARSTSSLFQDFTLEEVAGVTPVPLPAALPLFAGGLGLLGLIGWRRNRASA